jgi:putative copper export protein
MLALTPTLDTLRLFLHVLGASVWVGGQIVVGAIVPALRRDYPGATKIVARAFARVAWPAFALAVVTGMWSMMDVDLTNSSTSYQIDLFVKIVLVGLAAAMAVIHQFGRSTAALAIGGALGLLFSVAAMFFGFVLTTGA